MTAYIDFKGEPSECELYVRFAYHLIAKDYRAHKERYTHPQQGIYHLRMRLKPIDDMMLDLFLAAFQYLASRGVPMKFARTAMIERARTGMDFRSVVFVDYKGTRRDDPRIT
jgi:hypothetical protein